jgi:lysophospholipase L1-like esterase
LAFTYVTVTHTFEVANDVPASGAVEFTLVAPMRNEISVVAAPVKATLTVAGLISQKLAANTDPGTTPTGTTYKVTERLTGQPALTYYIQVPHDQGATIDLRALAGWVGGGGGGGGSGTVTSVNGEDPDLSGNIVLAASDVGAQPASDALTRLAAGAVPLSAVSGTITPNAALGYGPHRHIATSDVTLAAPTGGVDGQPIEVQVLASGATRTLTAAGASITIPAGSWWWGHFSYVSSSSTWLLDDSGGGGSTTITSQSQPTTSQTALAKLYAAVANRDAEAVIVHMDGDSYTQSFGSSYWPDRVSKYLQTRYPKLTGTEVSPTTDTATARGSRTAGVQIVNTAVGGQTSSNMLTGSEAAAVAALQPCAYLWMIGTNDTANSITAATHKTNLLSAIAYQKTNNPRKCVFVLIHPFERMDSYTAASPWADYATAEREIAAADPINVIAVDLSGAFALAGVPGSDPFGLVSDSDQLHPTGAAHALIADLVWAALQPTIQINAAAASGAPALFNTVLPAISGTATTGQTLTASTGTWSATPDSYTYQWRRAGSNISGATSSTYVLQVADEGQAITVTVTAAKAGYTSGSATSSSVTPSAGGGSTLTNTVLPAISGTTTEGQTLATANGTWSATPDSYTYQWKRAGSNISGATSSTYLLVTADVGATITVTVTASKTGYTSGSATSSGVGPVAPLGGADPTDTFNRADNASSLGSPSDGGAAYVTSGTHGIVSNAAYTPGTVSSAYYIRPLSGASEADAYVQAALVNGTVSKIALTLCDSSGIGYVAFLGLGSDTDSQLWTYNGGYSSLGVGLGSNTWVAGDIARLEKVGSSIKLYRNGVQVGSTGTDSTYATVTHGGIHVYQTNTSYRIDTLTMGAL